MLESEVIRDTKINLETKRVKMKQQGDQRFINRLTDNGTGSVRNLVRMFEGIGGMEWKEYDIASQVRNLDDYTDMESPSKRLRLTRHGPIQTPPSTPARASSARGPREGRGRSSPSCQDRWLKWPPVSPGCAKEAELPGLVTEMSRWTARFDD